MARKNGQLNYVPDSLLPKKRVPSTSKKLIAITLSCEHILRFKGNTPRKGELLWCFTCDGYRERV